MNKIFRNTLIFIAFVSVLNLLLNNEFKFLFIILALGSLVSYINKNMLIIFSAAFILVYLKEYNTVSESMAVLPVLGGAIGGAFTYLLFKDKPGKGKIKKLATMPMRKMMKFKDKAFPSLFPNAQSLVKVIKNSQSNMITSAILGSTGITQTSSTSSPPPSPTSSPPPSPTSGST